MDRTKTGDLCVQLFCATLARERWLIVAPHADDEIFAIPAIEHAQSQGIEIDLLILSALEYRRKEALNSCAYLNIALLIGSELGFEAEDGMYHEQISKLVYTISSLSSSYTKILAPALEGGHQDHDTAFLAVALSDAINQTSKGLYYHTYTAFGSKGAFSLGTTTMSYCPHSFRTVWSSKKCILYSQIVLALFIYKSQRATWILLFAGLLIKWLRGYTSNEILACEAQDISSLLQTLNKTSGKNCLYQIHNRLSQDIWYKHAKDAIQSLKS